MKNMSYINIQLIQITQFIAIALICSIVDYEKIMVSMSLVHTLVTPNDKFTIIILYSTKIQHG